MPGTNYTTQLHHRAGKNPRENITNMRSIQTIYLGGKKFE